ncbi:MAG: hypothetical protein AMXMBFR53_18080 [Gemmatimonadota bacterium]
MTLRHLAPALALLLALPPGSWAQGTDSLTARPDTVFAVEPLFVTASRLPGGGAGLGLTRTLVRPGPDASPRAHDALRSVPGAFVEEAAGPGGPAIVRLRGGEEVFTLVLVDGVPINQNGGFFDFLGLSLANVGGVDVARGPQSAVYGSSAVSGVVHFLTPRGEAGGPRVTARAEGGTASEHGGSWLAEGTARGGWERLRYSAGAGSAFWRGVYALPHDTRTDNVSLRLDWAPAPGWEATFAGRGIRVSSKLPVRDPGATRVPLDPNARNDRDRDVAGLTLRYTPSDRWSHYVRASRYGEGFVYEDAFDGVSGPADGSYFVFDANLRFTSDLTRTALEVGGSRAASRLRAAYGFLVEEESLEDRISGDFASDPLLLDRSSVAGFGEVAWIPSPSLTLGAGLRVERFRGLDPEATPRASLAWAPGSGNVRLRVAAGRAYKAPNLQQQYVDNPFIVANPDLRAETSTSVEVGLEVTSTGGGAHLSLAAFRQRFDDLIRTVGVAGDSRQVNRNLGRARSTGLEWAAEASLSPGWTVSSHGAVLDTEVLDAVGLSPAEYPEGDDLPFRPSYTGTLALAYRSDAGFEAAVQARGVGAQAVLTERFTGRRVLLPAYVLLGVTARYGVREGVDVYARLENVTGRTYETAFDRMGAPAQGVVGMAVRF